MKKRNRFLLITLVVALVAAGLIFLKTRALSEAPKAPTIEVTNENEPNQESMGVPLKEESLEDVAKAEEQKVFQTILNDLSACFELKSAVSNDVEPSTIESIINFVQTDLGPATQQSDRWMNWHLRNKDQEERRLRLEISEGDDGKMLRQLTYYAVDKEDLPVPIELPEEKSQNPSDEVIDQMLHEGEVFYKEKAGSIAFAGGEHIDYIEKNGTLSELEFQKGDLNFRCQTLKTPESCQCVR